MANYSDIRYEVTGTDVYTAVSDLPLSGVDTGTQAFVSGTNRLYLWTGTGWYNIALINTNPSLSGAASSYSLSNEGANTVVTLSSTDPEGLPISFSVSHSGLGVGANAIATVTQSNNIFTFTPTTNTALGGTFTTTFTASDGVNVAVANSSFTLAFKVNDSHYTTALITSVGTNNQVNNDFVDSSTNSHTITTYGNATQTTFSPYRHGGYSIYCDGANVMDLGFSTLNSGNWTFECWARVEVGETILGKYGGGNQLEAFGVHPTTGYMYTHTNVGVETPTCNTDLRDGKWHYLVWERYNGTYYYWADGSLETSFANSETPGATGNWGLGGVASGRFKGKIKEARFSLSTAVYSGSAPTTPTEPQTTSNATDAFFTGVGLEIKDYSSNNRTFTVPSTFESAPTTPYDYTEYSAGTNGGSMYLDGTGDYIGAQTSTAGTGDFTLEAWVYRTATGGTWQSIIAQRNGTSSASSNFSWGIHSSGYVYFYAGAHYASTAAGVIGLNRWHHIAFTRNGTTVKQFVDGVEKVSGTSSNNLSYDQLTIGANYTGTEPFTGIISDPRVVFGTSVYNSAFTPPTSPLTAISGTELLINGTNAGIIDKSQTAETLTLNGDAKSSTSQTKYLSSSIALDGTGDYIDIVPSSSEFFDFGTADFTIEFWMYLTNVSGEKILLESRAGHTDAGMLIMLNSGVIKTLTSGAVRTTGGTTIAADTWYYVAVVRDSTSLRTYLNGTEESGSASYNSAITAPFSKFRLGARFDGANPPAGYFSDVRVTKGLARYTANFTPPTAALEG